MNETEEPKEPIAPPVLKPVIAAPVQKPEKPVKPRGGFWPVLGILGFLILAAGEFYLWKLHQAIPAPTDYSGQIADLQSQIAALQQNAAKAQPAPDSVDVQANLGMKFQALTAQVTAIQTQVANDHGSLTALQANSTNLTSLTARIETLNRLESVRMALDEGQPLGDIPNAPPALAKFANVAPPTMAELELGFPAAAAKANDASVEKAQGGKSVWTGVLARFENLVTISDGSHVIVGAPAAAILAQAKDLLDAGDLNGALTVLNELSPTTQAALGDWLNQARDLAAARAAIIQMAGQS